MPWKYEFTADAVKDIKKLPPSVSKRIGIKLKWYIDSSDPLSYSVKLAGNGLAGDFRFRIGDYRVIFDADDKTRVITILSIAHRREVYRR